MTTQTTARTTTTGTRLLPALRILAALTVLNVLAQSITAGQLLGNNAGLLAAHGAGAITLHVLSGLTAVLAAVVWRRGGVGVEIPALAGLVFAATFVQAALGHYPTLWLHVPGAMLLAAGSVWVLYASLRADRSVTAGRRGR